MRGRATQFKSVARVGSGSIASVRRCLRHVALPPTTAVMMQCRERQKGAITGRSGLPDQRVGARRSRLALAPEGRRVFAPQDAIDIRCRLSKRVDEEGRLLSI